MSRWIEGNGRRLQNNDSRYGQLKYMYDEICCNDESEHCCDYAFDDVCKRCELFEKEDGVIE